MKIWHQQKRWVFFSITDPFRTHVTGFVLVYFSFTLRSISLFNSAKKRRQRKIISSLLGQTADLFAGRQILPGSNQTWTSSCEGENINWILQDSNFSNGFIAFSAVSHKFQAHLIQRLEQHNFLTNGYVAAVSSRAKINIRRAKHLLIFVCSLVVRGKDPEWKLCYVAVSDIQTRADVVADIILSLCECISPIIPNPQIWVSVFSKWLGQVFFWELLCYKIHKKIFFFLHPLCPEIKERIPGYFMEESICLKYQWPGPWLIEDKICCPALMLCCEHRKSNLVKDIIGPASCRYLYISCYIIYIIYILYWYIKRWLPWRRSWQEWSCNKEQMIW